MADSYVHANGSGFEVSGGSLALFQGHVVLNGTGFNVTGGAMNFAYSLVTQNTATCSVTGGGTLSESNPATSFVSPA